MRATGATAVHELPVNRHVRRRAREVRRRPLADWDSLLLCAALLGCSAGGGTTGSSAGGSAAAPTSGAAGVSNTGGVAAGGTAPTSGGMGGTGGPSGGSAGGGGIPTGGSGAVPAGGTGAAPAGGTAGTPSGGTAGMPSGGTAGTPSGGTAATASGGTGGAGGSIAPLEVMPPSYDPPGGLAVAQVPQFIQLGFDDNRFVDGIEWLLDLIEGRTNPPGSGNARTHDGQTIKVSFMFTSNALDEGGAALLEQWQRAVSAGHEVGNHTHTHEDVPNAPGVEWLAEINQCNSVLTSQLGIQQSDIWGIRAPYLSYDSALFTAIEQTDGLLYDCSVMHIPDPNRNYTYVWPYTLENDLHSSTQVSVGLHLGVWEMPVYNLPMDPSGYPNMCGFDTSVFDWQKSGPDFFDMMKWALDRRLASEGNRAPLTIGAHTDVYSAMNADAATKYDAFAPLAERRQAIEDFIAYALTKPDVRFVTAKQIIQWMSDPAPL